MTIPRSDARRSLAWASPVAVLGTLGIAAWCVLLYLAVAMGAGVASALFELDGELSAAPFWSLWAQGSALTWLVGLAGAWVLSVRGLSPRSAGLLGGLLGCGAGAGLIALVG